jgi:hypothetical protein
VNPQELFEQLLHAENEDEADRILDRSGFGLANEAAWRPLGDVENNFSTVGNQQTDATAALVEKIINGVDAVLMAEAFAQKVDPEGPTAPRSMNEAVARFLNVQDGRLDNLSAAQQTALADRIQVVAVGENASPSYLIVDRGEGQTPAMFPTTFLSLNKSNKMRIPFVQGKFNAGGTGVLQFCGVRNMQLIVSRRNPVAPASAGDNTKHLWGFTIVRRLRPDVSRRSSMYVYLAPDGMVPSFSADSIAVLPQKRQAVRPDPYSGPLEFGTCVKLYNYRWRAKSIATTDARYELERYLHSPCLPFRLTETRAYHAHYFSTTISGVWVSVATEAGETESAKVEPGFPSYAELDLPKVGRLPYRLVVFKEEVNKRHVPHGVFFTVNGQVHGGLPSDFVTRTLKFDYLANHLLVSVDCTEMDATVREDFFLASRDRVRKNEVYEQIVDALDDVLSEHQGLRDLNASRRKKEIEQAISDSSEATGFFSDLLKRDPALSALFPGGDRLVTSTGPGEAKPFVGVKFPTYFRLVKNPKDGLVKNCPINRTVRIDFETDAANDYFSRSDSPGKLTCAPPNLVEHAQLWNGRLTMRFRTPWNCKVGDRIAVKVVVGDIQTESRQAPFVSTFALLAEKESDPPPKLGGKPAPRKPVGDSKKSAPALALPNIVEVRKADWDKRKPSFTPYTSVQIKHDDKGGYDFFLNLDNAYLLTEVTRTKDADKPLVKFWFRWGLVLAALGMLQEMKQREDPTGQGPNGDAKGESEESEEGSGRAAQDLVDLARHCDGLARVIIPIIRSLYRGPQA